jgi:tRNA (guanine-N(7)-)-methyltransferase subunit TRM82
VPGTELLLSGGGDDWIGVWNWRANELVQKLDIRAALRLCVDPHTIFAKDNYLISVSGIWTVPYGEPADNRWAIIVTIEHFPTLFIAVVHPRTSKVSRFGFLGCEGTPVDIIAIENSIVVSFDPRVIGRHRLETLVLHPDPLWPTEDRWEQFQPRAHQFAHVYDSRIAALNELPDVGPTPTKKELDDLLYGVSDLRKRGGTASDADPPADA